MDIWDQQGNLRCSNAQQFDCQVFKERGSKASTDNSARLHGWKIFGDRAHCPECAKPIRRTRITSTLEQDGLPGIVFPVVSKASKSSRKSKHIA